MDGLEVCRRVRDLAGYRPTMVALTGLAEGKDRARTTAAGFDLHLVKPVPLMSLADLASRVAQQQAHA
jgi:CheY-like chemotaxis protein